MKYCFKSDNLTDTEYINEHDSFLREILVNSVSDLKGISYRGRQPLGCKVVKFSDYLNLNGCIQTPNGFCGIFGTKTYNQLLRQFLIETVEDYEGTVYKVDIDVSSDYSEDTSDALSFYVDNLMSSK